jgi:hypothetical protein
MSDRFAADRAASGGFGRYLRSRKNLAGLAGAVVGVGLHAAGLVGDLWPAVAVALYGAGALVGPSDPPTPELLTDTLRREAAALVSGVRRRDLPPDVYDAVVRIAEVLRLVLDRLDQVADRPADRAAAPERLAAAASIIHDDLPTCLATYRDRSPSGPQQHAAAELATQLGLVARAADRLAAEVPDVGACRAEELTEELRKRYGDASP